MTDPERCEVAGCDFPKNHYGIHGTLGVHTKNPTEGCPKCGSLVRRWHGWAGPLNVCPDPWHGDGTTA